MMEQKEAPRAAESNNGTDVSVIIANYNARDLLRRCLESIYAHPASRPFEVLVVDDASSDGSAEMVRANFPQVCLIANSRNLGYARSNNNAIAKSSGRYVYLLNSDTVLLPGAIDHLAEFLESHPEAGAAGSLLLNGDGSLQESVKSFPSVRSAFFGKRSFLHRWFPQSRFTKRELLQWKGENEEPFLAGYVSSASLMIPRAVIREVGGLDTRMWHFIDADYCKRVWDTDRSVFCVPEAKVIHLDHQGGTMADWRKRYRSVVTFHYGAHLYFRKHSGRPWWHPMHAIVLAGLGARFLASLVLQGVKELLRSDPRAYDRARQAGSSNPPTAQGGGKT